MHDYKYFHDEWRQDTHHQTDVLFLRVMVTDRELAATFYAPVWREELREDTIKLLREHCIKSIEEERQNGQR